ncbi:MULTISPECIES: tRNA 2-selenouridine(34) synthase MnmH [unclassified Duganella]|uniref:tRNA 2-selenouridine(34) synthase MnmH n=1 Tax=unclassified Duganella TaxID=2636909 RepID=UPI0006F2E743|nr:MULTISPECIES: tRNA 2-selenouridine(34) synthase MnmH [unclassified Duganella]KQV56428.1 tRNA 2-selenouridine synthase [Duganella sp. Root336D2]KRB96497.1 tRNA 2-selenouridine synthase [Duganella sp. Root198D2]
MKYPEILSIEDVLSRLDDFDTIIDARSPSEYALDHLPNAINCPVLDDEQRIAVGTMYKQVGSFEAKKVGAAMVSKNIGYHIETLWLDKPRDWKPLIYCWRGGNRSGSMATVLAKIGWPVVQLDGGYKAFRGAINAQLEQTPELDFRVICGTTGSGKTRLLDTLEAIGAQVLDLEQLAAHRGSVLGNIPCQPQPSQKAFETSIWDRLRRYDPGLPVFVEAESRKVGSLRVPGALMERMRASPCISMQVSREDRVKLLIEDYQHFACNAPALNAQLEFLVQLHGRERIERWQAMAFAGDMPALVDELLVDHYDPAYLKSIDRNFVQFEKAIEVALPDISPDSFVAAARKLHGA